MPISATTERTMPEEISALGRFHHCREIASGTGEIVYAPG